MGITRADLVRGSGSKDLEMSDEEWKVELAERQLVLSRYMANDDWNQKIFKKVGILITSHPGNRPYLYNSIRTHKELGYWICLAYDNYLHPEDPNLDYNRIMPSKDTMDMVDTFIMPHYQTWGGVLYPYFWLLKFGVAALKDFEYIYCTNGDFILEKPEGFHDLLVMMGEADIMTCGHNEHNKYANTAGFIVKTEAMLKIVKHWQDRFIPFEVYEKYTQEIGNAEGRFGVAIADLGLTVAEVIPPADDMLKIPGTGTWCDKMGFRHIHAEHNSAYRRKGIPPHYKYLDPRFMGDEYNQIKAYWDMDPADVGGRLKILEGWWAKE